LNKIVDNNQRNWHLKLTDALWERRMTPKDNTRMSPNTLVYGKEEKILINLELNSLTFVINTKSVEYFSPIQQRVNQLLKLEEERSQAMNKNSQRQQSVLKYFD
jgi:hypothetical protein